MSKSVSTDITLSDLRLDQNNPRFGSPAGVVTQKQLLTKIVKDFGIEDVISSIAVNGYIDAEPMVVSPSPQEDGKYIVVEGNRRLAAMLVLSGDELADGFTAKTEKYQKLHKDSGEPSYNPVPCVEFDVIVFKILCHSSKICKNRNDYYDQITQQAHGLRF